MMIDKLIAVRMVGFTGLEELTTHERGVLGELLIQERRGEPLAWICWMGMKNHRHNLEDWRFVLLLWLESESMDWENL